MMKKIPAVRMQAPCFFCSLNRAWTEIQLATDDPELQAKTMREMLKTLYENSEHISEMAPDDERQSPAWIGTLRERLIKQLTNNPNFYAELKQQANEAAMQIIPLFQKQIDLADSPRARFRMACLASVAANAIELDVAGHEFSLSQLQNLLNNAEVELAIDQIDELFNAAKNAEQILYLTDNAGEIAFDTLFVHELKSLAPVIVAVRGQPVMNDATLQDAEAVGMTQITEVITTGADCVGVILSQVSSEFHDTFFASDLVVSKGMANLETLSVYDIQQPVIYALYRTKCQPIADFSDVPRHRNVVARLDYLKTR
jgi:uncharacterized protein with ATP-grasp and redox domains